MIGYIISVVVIYLSSMIYKRKKSRLARHQRKTLTRQTVLFLMLAGFLIFSIFKWGLPGLIRLAIFVGDLGSSSKSVEQSDTIAPIPPRLVDLPSATPSGSLTIKGFAEAGTTVSVFVNNNQRAEVVADSQGEFGADGVDLIMSKNRIWAKAKDSAGNESKQSEEVLVVVDGDAPKLIVSEPPDGAKTGDGAAVVNGTVSEVEAEVTVNGKFVGVDDEGRFSTRVNLETGENLIVVVAQDEAGNQTKVEIKIERV